MFSTSNYEVRALLLPFPVYGKGSGDRSKIAKIKLLGYRENLCMSAKLPVSTRRRHKNYIAVSRTSARGE